MSSSSSEAASFPRSSPHWRGMSEGQSQRSVTSSAQHRQEVEVAAAEERERATTETAATAARAARLAMAELATARAEVEAAAAADAARAAVAELEALRGSSISSSVSADSGTDGELKLARETA
jgi:membrane protein involved in colicin uptake